MIEDSHMRINQNNFQIKLLFNICICPKISVQDILFSSDSCMISPYEGRNSVKDDISPTNNFLLNDSTMISSANNNDSSYITIHTHNNTS